MEFDKSKILTAVTADQAKVGDMGWITDTLAGIRTRVERGDAPKELTDVLPADYTHRFKVEGNAHNLFYPAPYSYLQEQWVQENDLNVGDKVRIEHIWGGSKERAFQEPYITHYFYQVGRVIDIHPDRIVLQLKTTQASVPYFAIEKVKEPEYRPFANAEEFAPYRDRWFIDKHDSDIVRVELYCNSGITEVRGYCSYDELLNSYTFDDGTPAGVRV